MKTIPEIAREATKEIMEGVKGDPILVTKMQHALDAHPDDFIREHPEIMRAVRRASGGQRRLDATGGGKMQGITTLHVDPAQVKEITGSGLRIKVDADAIPDGTTKRGHFLPTMDQQHRLITDMAQRSFPGLVRAFALPSYRNAGNYRSYRMVEEGMISNAIDVAARIVTDGYEVAEQSVAHVVFGVSLALRRDRFPMYWVGQELMAALIATELPRDVQFEDIKWPHRAVIFMLPQGALRSPGGAEIVSLAVARIETDEELGADDTELSATLPSISGGVKGGAGVWAHMIDHHLDSDVHRAGCLADNCHEGDAPCLANWAMDAPFDRFIEFEDDPDSLPEIGDVKSEPYLTLLPRLAMNLLLTLAFKPELIERSGKQHKALMKASDGTRKHVVVWEPRYLGRRYRFAREREAQGGTHASPRSHWRRGHWRDVRVGARLLVAPDGTKQPIPKEQRMTKPTWIEPVLVNVNEEAKS